MTPNELQHEIRRVESAAGTLRERKHREEAVLADALGADPQRYSATVVRRAREALAATEQHLSDTEARCAALCQQLPNEGQVAAARDAAEALRSESASLAEQEASAFAAFLTALESAEEFARQLVALRRRLAATTEHLTDVRRTYGFGITIPSPPAPSRAEATIAAHVAKVLERVAKGGEADDTVEINLQSARAERAAQRRSMQMAS